jgi:hypothetical protein
MTKRWTRCISCCWSCDLDIFFIFLLSFALDFQLILQMEIFFFQFNLLVSHHSSLYIFIIECFDLLANCFNPDDLWMKACYFQGIEILRISGLKLLSLTMERWIEYEFYKVEITEQKIVFFSFDNSKMLDFSVTNLASILTLW